MASTVNSWKLLWTLLGPILWTLWVDIRKALGRACRSAWAVLELSLRQ